MSYLGDSDPTVVDATLAGSIVQVVTHIVFVVSLYFFLKWRAYYAATIASQVALFSDMYHICKAQWFCFGLESIPGLGTALERLRLMDHIHSNHACGAIVLIAALSDGGGGKHKIMYQLLLMSITIFANLAFPFRLQATFIMVTYLVLVIVFEYLVIRKGRLPPADRFHGRLLIIALAVSGIGLFLYFSTSFIPHEIAHGLWHLVIGIAFLLIELAVNQRRLLMTTTSDVSA